MGYRYFFIICSKLRLLLVLLVGGLLGCTSNNVLLGVSDLEWESYSPKKQKEMLEDRRNLVENRKEKLREISRAAKSETHNKAFLKVSIRDGKVMFPPSFLNWQAYKPLAFTVASNQCVKVDVTNVSDAKTNTRLDACFYDGVLYLDPSRYDLDKGTGTAIFYFSPLWLEGFEYKKISSDGYLRMHDVSVSILQQSSV